MASNDTREEEKQLKREAIAAKLMKALDIAVGDETIKVTHNGRTVESSGLDLKAAAMLADRLANLYGLNAPSESKQTIDVNTPSVDFTKIPKEDRDRMREIAIEMKRITEKAMKDPQAA